MTPPGSQKHTCAPPNPPPARLRPTLFLQYVFTFSEDSVKDSVALSVTESVKESVRPHTHPAPTPICWLYIGFESCLYVLQMLHRSFLRGHPGASPRTPPPLEPPQTPRVSCLLFSCGPHTQSASGSRAVMRACCVWSGGACWLRQVSCGLPPNTKSFPGASQEYRRGLPVASQEHVLRAFVCMCMFRT